MTRRRYRRTTCGRCCEEGVSVVCAKTGTNEGKPETPVMIKSCENCGRPFVPSKFHPEQAFCGASACRVASACAARKKWRTSRQEKDPEGFNQQEAKRVREYRRRKRHGLAAMSPLRLSEKLGALEKLGAVLVELFGKLASAVGGSELLESLTAELAAWAGAFAPDLLKNLAVTGYGS